MSTIRVFLISLAIAAVTTAAMAKDAGLSGKDVCVSAEVVSVDMGDSRLVIKTTGGDGSYGYVNLKVIPETGFSRGSETISMPDLKPGDKATVDYVTDPAGISVAVSVYLEAENDAEQPSILEEESGNIGEGL